MNTGLFGNTKKKQRQAHPHSTKGDNKGRPAKWVTYCPECPTVAARPQDSPRVITNPKQRIAKAKCGHTWPIAR